MIYQHLKIRHLAHYHCPMNLKMVLVLLQNFILTVTLGYILSFIAVQCNFLSLSSTHQSFYIVSIVFIADSQIIILVLFPYSLFETMTGRCYSFSICIIFAIMTVKPNFQAKNLKRNDKHHDNCGSKNLHMGPSLFQANPIRNILLLPSNSFH